MIGYNLQGVIGMSYHVFNTVSAKVRDAIINKDDSSIIVYQHSKRKVEATKLSGRMYVNNKFVGVATNIVMPTLNNGGAL